MMIPPISEPLRVGCPIHTASEFLPVRKRPVQQRRLAVTVLAQVGNYFLFVLLQAFDNTSSVWRLFAMSLHLEVRTAGLHNQPCFLRSLQNRYSVASHALSPSDLSETAETRSDSDSLLVSFVSNVSLSTT